MSPRARIVSAAAAAVVAMAAGHEGLRHYPYRDPPGILTVCYGHTGGVQQRRYTLAECRKLLSADALHAVQVVERCVPGLPEQVLAAFADAVFNLGPKVACDTAQSTAARLLRAGRLREACDQLPRWDKARIGGVLVPLGGLTRRRADERALCLQGVMP